MSKAGPSRLRFSVITVYSTILSINHSIGQRIGYKYDTESLWHITQLCMFCLQLYLLVILIKQNLKCIYRMKMSYQAVNSLLTCPLMNS